MCKHEREDPFTRAMRSSEEGPRALETLSREIFLMFHHGRLHLAPNYSNACDIYLHSWRRLFELNIFGRGYSGSCARDGGVSAFRHHSHAGDILSNFLAKRRHSCDIVSASPNQLMLGELAVSADISGMARCEYASLELAHSYSNLDPIAGRVTG
jgi:hypothetical protein